MVSRIVSLGVAAFACLAGCGSDGGGAAPDAGGPGADGAAGGATVEIGTGESAFVPIAATGAALEVVMGPQGGWHVLVTCRFSGLSPDGLLLRYDVREDGRADMWNVITEYVLAADRVTPDGAGYVRVGDRAVFDITSAADIVGRLVTVRVCLTPPGGAAPVCDARPVQLIDDLP